MFQGQADRGTHEFAVSTTGRVFQRITERGAEFGRRLADAMIGGGVASALK